MTRRIFHKVIGTLQLTIRPLILPLVCNIPKALPTLYSTNPPHHYYSNQANTKRTTIMSPNIPDKQWAMVIEKTGGPVDYKQIPGT